jgi:hypothetical protein
LKAKKLSLEPAIHIPLFVRYPKWFQQNTIIEDQFATNLDIAPTILDAAGISNTYGMDGFSLRELYNGTKQRNIVYVELMKSDVDGYADLRSVRTNEYKYNYYFCSDTTEEFFDLTLDPLENTNLINEATYQPLINEYRLKLDSMKTAVNDTITEDITDCHLVSGQRMTPNQVKGELKATIYPNPASSYLVIQFPDPGTSFISIYSPEGKLQQFQKTNFNVENTALKLDISALPDGLYVLILQNNNSTEAHKLMVLH